MSTTTIVVIGAVAVVAFLAWRTYSNNSTALAGGTNTVSVGGRVGGVGIAGNLNLNTLAQDLGNIF